MVGLPLHPKYYLGLDPGLRRMGWALVDADGKVGRAGCYFICDGSLVEKIDDILTFLRLRFLGIGSVVGIEFPFVGRNSQVALHVAACWGAVAATLSHMGACVAPPVYPASAKKALTGDGNATKPMVFKYAREAGLMYDETVGRYDVADAVAVAMAAKLWYEKQECIS